MLRKEGSSRPTVFLSYAKEDKHQADELEKKLTSSGIDVWRFTGTSSIAAPEPRTVRGLEAGDEIDPTIKAQQAAACSTILLWTPNSVKSEYILKHEARNAIDEGKLLSVLSQVEPNSIPQTFTRDWAVTLDQVIADPPRLVAKIHEMHLRMIKRSGLTRRNAMLGASAGTLLGSLLSYAVPRLVSGLSGWTQREEQAAKDLYKVLGLNTNPRVIFGSEYKNYPNINALAGRSLPSTRSEKTAREVVEFAQSVNMSSALSVGTFDKFFRPEPGQSALSVNSLLVNARPKVFWQPEQVHESIVAISSSKTNPATRHMMGYLTGPEAPKDFISLDGTWGARLKINQYVSPTSIRVVRDPIFKDWARYDAAMVVGDKVDQTVTGCHFTITKVEKSWLRGSKRQSVVIISALHGPGLAAARSLFKRPLSPVALDFIDALRGASSNCDSWQAWARVIDVEGGGAEYGVASIDLKDFWSLEPFPISV